MDELMYFQTPFISRVFSVIFIYFWRFLHVLKKHRHKKFKACRLIFSFFLLKRKINFTISSIHVQSFIYTKVERALGKITHECFLFHSIVFISSILYYVLNVPQFTQLIFCSFEVLRKHGVHLHNLLKIISV